MSFIATPSHYRFPWYVKLFFWNQRRRYGRVLEPARLRGRMPKVFIAGRCFMAPTIRTTAGYGLDLYATHRF